MTITGVNLERRSALALIGASLAGLRASQIRRIKAGQSTSRSNLRSSLESIRTSANKLEGLIQQPAHPRRKFFTSFLKVV